jgi:hypothetical protein
MSYRVSELEKQFTMIISGVETALDRARRLPSPLLPDDDPLVGAMHAMEGAIYELNQAREAWLARQPAPNAQWEPDHPGRHEKKEHDDGTTGQPAASADSHQGTEQKHRTGHGSTVGADADAGSGTACETGDRWAF